jgi:hypothetical protein
MTCTNLFSLVCSFLFLGTVRGNCGTPQRCTQWSGNCALRFKERTWTRAIFCANFGCNVTGLGISRKLWCRKCYTSAPSPEFVVGGIEPARLNDEDEDRLSSGWARRPEDSTRFRSGRDGDDLMVSFECDECVFGKLFWLSTRYNV